MYFRAALKITEVDLTAAKSHRDQYQEISQASEAALSALNTTFDDYKASSEASITRHEVSFQFLIFAHLFLHTLDTRFPPSARYSVHKTSQMPFFDIFDQNSGFVYRKASLTQFTALEIGSTPTSSGMHHYLRNMQRWDMVRGYWN